MESGGEDDASLTEHVCETVNCGLLSDEVSAYHPKHVMMRQGGLLSLCHAPSFLILIGIVHK